MIFVIMAHASFLHSTWFPEFYWLYWVAPAAFILASGLSAGLVGERNRQKRRFYIVYAWRGLLLLVVGHILITTAATHTPYSPVWEQRWVTIFWKSWHITDTFGIIFLVGPYLITKISSKGRVLTGLCLIIGSNILFVLLSPYLSSMSVPWAVAKDLLVGIDTQEGSNLLYLSFPIIPWLGYFLVSSALGTALTDAKRSARLTDYLGFLKKVVFGMALVAVLCIVIRLVVKETSTGLFSPVATMFFRISRDSVSIPYVAMYGFVALLFFWYQLWRLDVKGVRTAGDQLLECLGSYSLSAFFIQYYVTWWLPRALGVNIEWPVIVSVVCLIGMVGITFCLTYLWRRLHGYPQVSVLLNYLWGMSFASGGAVALGCAGNAMDGNEAALGTRATTGQQTVESRIQT